MKLKIDVNGILTEDRLALLPELTKNEKKALALCVIYTGMVSADKSFKKLCPGHFYRSNGLFKADLGMKSNSNFFNVIEGLMSKGLLRRRAGSYEKRRVEGVGASEYLIPDEMAEWRINHIEDSEDFTGFSLSDLKVETKNGHDNIDIKIVDIVDNVDKIDNKKIENLDKKDISENYDYLENLNNFNKADNVEKKDNKENLDKKETLIIKEKQDTAISRNTRRTSIKEIEDKEGKSITLLIWSICNDEGTEALLNWFNSIKDSLVEAESNHLESLIKHTIDACKCVEPSVVKEEVELPF